MTHSTPAKRNEAVAKQLFIVGCPRSGTTLLASMLTSHPRIAIMGETHFIPILCGIGSLAPSAKLTKKTLINLMSRNGRLALSGIGPEQLDIALGHNLRLTVADAVQRLHAWYAETNTALLSGDKTPAYVLHIPTLSKLLPDAVFVHIIRNGKHVAHSLVSKDWGPSSYAGAAVFWERHVKAGRNSGKSLGESRYLEIRYEDLIARDEIELQRICRFLSLPYEEDMRSFQTSGEMFSQRNFNPTIHQRLKNNLEKSEPTLALRDENHIEQLAGNTLSEFGYEVLSAGEPSFALKAKAAIHDFAARTPVNRQRVKTLFGMR